MHKLQFLIFASLLAVAASPASALYKCKDSKGKTYYTDRPPAECAGKEMDVLSTQGTVVKKREAALTPEQQAARDAEEKRKKEEEALAKEEKRKNQALLNTYANVKDIEDGRQRALKQSEDAAKEIEKRIALAQKHAMALAAEKEFYVKKPMPKKLQDDVRNNEIDLKTQQDALQAKKKELGEINAKYDEDKQRYLEITGAKPKAAPAAKK
ncbi:MAG: DUF4124 domain-containing protein [Betaproteobacteria bacterium]|nr:MAG: DUF4124 domain-containing protein [Betaproteobacteria bacterium]